MQSPVSSSAVVATPIVGYPSRAYLLTEFVGLFFGAPLAYLSGFRMHPVLLAGLVATVLLATLSRNPRFSSQRFWNHANFRWHTRNVAALFALMAALVAIGVLFLAPERFLDLPQHR